MKAKELLQHYANKTYHELWQEAYDSWCIMTPYFNGISDDEDGTLFTFLFLSASLAIDKTLSNMETKLVCDLFGVDEATAKQAFNKCDSALIKDVYKFFDSIRDEKLRQAIASFCVCFLVVDGTCNSDEVNFLARLID